MSSDRHHEEVLTVQGYKLIDSDFNLWLNRKPKNPYPVAVVSGYTCTKYPRAYIKAFAEMFPTCIAGFINTISGDKTMGKKRKVTPKKKVASKKKIAKRETAVSDLSAVQTIHEMLCANNKEKKTDVFLVDYMKKNFPNDFFYHHITGIRKTRRAMNRGLTRAEPTALILEWFEEGTATLDPFTAQGPFGKNKPEKGPPKARMIPWPYKKGFGNSANAKREDRVAKKKATKKPTPAVKAAQKDYEKKAQKVAETKAPATKKKATKKKVVKKKAVRRSK